MRRGVFVLFLAVATCLVAIPTARAQTGTPVVFLDGKGFGHGVGLAQWGAKYMADAGASHEDILGTFYPGTALSAVNDQDVRVAVYTSPNGQATLTFPTGGEVRSSPGGEQAPGFPVQVGPGGSVIVSYDGAYHVTPGVTAQAAGAPVAWESPQQQPNCVVPGITCPPTTPPPGGGGGGCVVCTTSTTTPQPPATTPPGSSPPPQTAPPPTEGAPSPPPSSTAATSSTPVWSVPYGGGTTGVSERGRHYRGLVEATAGGGPLRLVNQLSIETYLRGMGEVPSSWPVEAIAAQTVAARTYALRAMSFSGELCDYDLCQVYIGADRETAGQNAAVDATVGQVLTYGGALASTVYSADAGGVTATTLEGFGSPDGVYPYLTVVRYNTPDPLPWRSEIALTDVGSRFGYPGTVTDVRIAQPGPSGRALQVTLDGSSGPTTIDGRQFAARLGLRSTLFQPTIGTDDNPPAPPAAGGVLQALPDDAATIRQAALTGQTTAALNTANLRGMRDWGNGLLSSLARKTHAAADLASRPATWLALLLAALATALAFREFGFSVPPVALQLADRRTWPAPWREPRPSSSRLGIAQRITAVRVARATSRQNDDSSHVRFQPEPDAGVARATSRQNDDSSHVRWAPEVGWEAAVDWEPLFQGSDADPSAAPDADRPAPKDRPTMKLRFRRN